MTARYIYDTFNAVIVRAIRNILPEEKHFVTKGEKYTDNYLDGRTDAAASNKTYLFLSMAVKFHLLIFSDSLQN